MNGCPIAYVDPCTSCPQYGNCAPSQAVEKMKELESLVLELRRMIAGMEINAELRSGQERLNNRES